MNATTPEDLAFDKADPIEKIKECYKTNGIVLLRDLIPKSLIESFKSSINKVIQARLNSLNIQVEKSSTLDENFDKLCKTDRSLGGELYDHIRDFPEFFELLACREVVDWVKILMDEQEIQIPFDLSLFHINRPNEDKFVYSWHQDYTYNLLSLNSVTTWFALTSVEQSLGPLKVLPGSHHEIRKVTSVNLDFKSGKGGGGKLYQLDIDEEECERTAISVPTKPGEVLFFSSLLLHSSGRNRGDRSRWVVNSRYGHFIDEKLIKRGFHSGRDKERKPQFHLIHPELVSQKPSFD